VTGGLVNLKFSMFFDKGAVLRAVDRAERQVLSKAGAFVRRRAKSAVRKRKRVSEPGQAPSSHAGHLRRLILFGYDRAASSVVIGPLLFRSRSSPTVPELLEFGGIVTRERKGRRRRTMGVRRRMRYRPRPFMGPALEAEAPNFPSLWKDSVRAR
jgi:hypothetical protein